MEERKLGGGGKRESTKLGQKLRPGIVLRGGGEEGMSQSRAIHKKGSTSIMHLRNEVGYQRERREGGERGGGRKQAV